MKLLVDTSFTNKYLNRCSSHYLMRVMVERALEKMPDLYVYYILPEVGDSNWVQDEALPVSDRITAVHLPCLRDRYKEFFIFKKEWTDYFAPWGKYWDWDVYFTNKAPIVGQAMLCASKVIVKSSLIMDPMPVCDFKKTVNVYNKNDDFHYLTYGGYMAADTVLVNATHEVSGILQTARRFLAPTKLEELSKKVRQSFLSPFRDGFDPNYPRSRPRTIEGPMRVVYPQRLDKTERRPERAFEVFRYAFVTDTAIRFEIMTNSAIRADAVEDLGFVPCRKPKRDEFWSRLKQTHVYVSWALEEGLPLSLTEATMLGVIGVVKKEPWSVGMMGEDYPWLVRNADEGIAAIKTIHQNYGEAYEKWLKWFEGFWLPVIEKHGKIDEELLLFLQNRQRELLEIGQKRSIEPGEMIDFINKNVGMLGQRRFNLLDVCKRLSRWGDIRSDFEVEKDYTIVPFSRSPGFYDLKVDLMHHGWRDGPGVGELWKTPEEFEAMTGRRVE